MKPLAFRYFWLLALLINTCSCVSTHQHKPEEIFGIYERNGDDGGHIRHILILNDDYTFEYSWLGGLIWGTTIGTWYTKRREIILNSDSPSHILPQPWVLKKYAVEEPADSVKIILKDSDSAVTIPFALCILKSDTSTVAESVSNFDGICYLPDLLADSIEVSFVGFERISVKHDIMVVEYRIGMTIDPKEIVDRFFIDERWRIKNKKLYDSKIEKRMRRRQSYYSKMD